MGAARGRAVDALAALLFAEPYRFEFFQAVRLLERLLPEREPVGKSGGSPAGEVVRFRTHASLAFPASQIHSLTPAAAREEGGGEAGAGATARDAAGEQPEMVVNFMGLTGPSGTLPAHYTELLAERARYKDTAYWEFLDLFNHRLISLFYRAWEKYRFHVAYERGDRDRFTEYLFDLVGLGTRGLKGRLGGQDDEGLLFYGGLVAQRPHSASALAALLGDSYGVPAKVEQFTGQWLALEAESLTRLGAANSRLGVDLMAGERVWDRQSKFRLSFGPLTLEEFRRFLPVGPALGPAVKTTRLLVGLEFDFDVELRLRAAEVPGWLLGAAPEEGPRLGWTSWLKTLEFGGADARVVLPVRE
ncbi:MAG TPA: type VI secretion system baseplate subunit TssG [Pyrinomonadaceae bacterium]|jgi:type VI secretion system protein ImpH|nr:type VI secretion system baseplate subunit TssG [Pyrinomonadaceae bacterium]